ncbi:hypothetical protein [Ancylobacter oerskovii]|uniref:Uncharacterized protein n=1 Tax=Ancylobacter oerskovii TaxID=459519 RepID=A0ABW4YVQ3_9HYPH|nr:hypothetical protein [Ancylobacter oerskovii]MBS7544319.1 hypothetical protein [Ancylobacter oerskovii]
MHRLLQKISDIKDEVDRRQWHTASHLAKMLELEIIDAIRANAQAVDVCVKPSDVGVTRPPDYPRS